MYSPFKFSIGERVIVNTPNYRNVKAEVTSLEKRIRRGRFGEGKWVNVYSVKMLSRARTVRTPTGYEYETKTLANLNESSLENLNEILLGNEVPNGVESKYIP
jgi:hypothetical protein